MEKNTEKPGRKELDVWIKKQLDAAVRKLMKEGVVDSLIVEAKPSWVLPFQILIGKIRAQAQSNDFEWFICGEVPTDYVAATAASTPRETAKHFALKWQLAAARHEEKMAQDQTETTGETQQVDSSRQLIGHAEALYELVEIDGLWLTQSNS